MNIRQSLATFTARENLVTLAIAALSSAAIFAVALVQIQGDRELAFNNEVTKNSNLVQAHAERAFSELQLLDLVLLTLRNDHEMHRTAADLNIWLAALNLSRDSIGIVSVIGAQGAAILSTSAPDTNNYADREYFKTHAADSTDRLLIGKPVLGRVSGKWIVPITRRINQPDGSFGGVVFMAANPEFFARDYKTAVLGSQASIALIGLDGTTRVRRNSGKISYGGDVSASQLFREIPKAPVGHYVGIAASDGVRRTISYRVLEDYPLAVVVASSIDDVSASLAFRERTYLVAASVASLLVMAIALMFTRNQARRRRDEASSAALEAQVREAQKLTAVGTLAGGIAHDFNNILATILGNTALARSDVGTNSDAALESLEEIQKAAMRARDLVQQILSFSRRSPTEKKPVELTSVVEESARLLRATLPGRLKLRVNCAAGGVIVLVDQTQILQVLINLATNAMQAMREGPGCINMILDILTLDAVPVSTRPQLKALYASHLEHVARLVVSDDGPGMDAATLERIFEPFFTTKPPGEGTGLGLSVVHGIVQAHGGAIEVQSALGKGTTFTIYLPVAKWTGEAPNATGAGLARAAASAISGGRDERRHILYLDDEEALASLMKRFLEPRGYRVSSFVKSEEALAALRDAPEAFHLVVTDYNMPGMSGLDVARAVRAIRADLPVAVVSGFVDVALRENADQAGVREIIFKADDLETFCAAVQRLVEGPGKASQSASPT
jgi:signal transduction histidine kinase/ActR/RegA family two-component response regulator